MPTATSPLFHIQTCTSIDFPNCFFFISGVLAVGFSVFLKFAEVDVSDGKAWAIVITVIFVLFMVLLLVSLACQPQNKSEVSFKVNF